MKIAKKRRQPVSPSSFEPLEPRQLLSASLSTAIGFGTTSPYGESITGMAVDSTGNIYVAGYFEGSIDVDPTAGTTTLTSAGGYDIFLMKYTAAGSLVWAKSFGSPANFGIGGNDMGGDILLDASGNILLTGSFSNTIDMDAGAGTTNLVSVGGTDALVAKYDNDGNFLWAKGFGGAADDTASKIKSDGKTGYLLMGGYGATADLDPGLGIHNATATTLWDEYISHIDTSGNLIWSDQFTAPSTLWIGNIAVDNSGNVLAAGFFQGQADFNPGLGKMMLGKDSALLGFVAKFTPAGKLVWAKTLGQGTGGFGDAAFIYDMTLDSQNNIILAGSFGGTIDVNPGPAVHTLTEQQSPDAFTGFVMKLNRAGGFRWAGAIDGDSWSDAYAVTTDASDNIYVTGELNGTNHFDITGTSADDTLTSLGQDDAFLSKYDAAGHLAWAQSMGSDGYDHGMHLASGPSDSIYACGYFTSTAHFGPAIGGTDLVALGNQDSFIAIFNQTPFTTDIAVHASSDVAILGGVVTLTATLAIPQGVSTGKIVFKDGTRLLATATIDSTGHATCRFVATGLGIHNITATYLGDDNFAAATSLVLNLTVTRANMASKLAG